MILREAELSDVPQIVEIYSYYVLNTPYTFETEVPTIEDYEERMKSVKKNFPFFVIENKEKEIISFSYAHYYHVRKAYRWTIETSIYVKNGLQVKGIGKKIYETLLHALKDQGVVNVYATLGCPNIPSAKFHEKMGFKKIATLPKVGYKFGEWHDVEYYQLTLNDPEENPKEIISFSQLDHDKYLKITN